MFPVATPPRARSPRSTVASLEGSISWLGLRAAITPYPPAPSTTRIATTQIIRRRRFLPFFPLVKPFPLMDIRTLAHSSHPHPVYQYVFHPKKFQFLTG